MVDFYELDGSPTEEWGTDGYFVGKRRLMCNWADRYTLLQEASSGNVKVYPYNKPLQAYAVGATIMPFGDEPNEGDEADQLQYGTAIVTITYAIQPYYPQPIGNFAVVEQLHPYYEYVLLPETGLHVGSAGGANPTKAQRVMTGGLEYNLSIYDLAIPSVTGINMMYTCNESLWYTYLLDWYFNPKKMLLVDVSPQANVRLGTSMKYQMHYKFRIRAEDWDKCLTENGWETIYNDAGLPIVGTSNFNLLRP